jgi:hypothetical protein
VLGEDGKHALHAAQDGAVHDDRPLDARLSGVLQVKPARRVQAGREVGEVKGGAGRGPGLGDALPAQWRDRERT